MVQGKGHIEKNNFNILVNSVYKNISDYLDSRPDKRDPTTPLVVSESNQNKGEGITERSVSRAIKDLMKRIGLDSPLYTAHSLRHTCATQILKATNDISQVQSTLRHSSVATSQIYLESKATDRRLKLAPEQHLDKLFI